MYVNWMLETWDKFNSLRPSDACICVGKLTIIGSDNGLWSDRRHAICYLNPRVWTNAGILLIWPLGTNFSEILIEMPAAQQYSIKWVLSDHHIDAVTYLLMFPKSLFIPLPLTCQNCIATAKFPVVPFTHWPFRHKGFCRCLRPSICVSVNFTLSARWTRQLADLSWNHKICTKHASWDILG